MNKKVIIFIIFFINYFVFSNNVIQLGVDAFFQEGHDQLLKGKRIGLITNQTGINRAGKKTLDLFMDNSSLHLVALFSPEHGINGVEYAWEKVRDALHEYKIPIYSLHGTTRRPTKKMLKGIDVLVYDIQDVGVRTYTYATTLFYVMEEAAKAGIQVIVLDRPNPMGGEVVDGAMLDEKFRSYVGYINVPYCHGMTIGELARFFNSEYKIRADLKVVRMKGWDRRMTFSDTGLIWVPTSPHIPESDSPLYYASTGLLGELSLVNIGVGYSLPFKLIGAEWIDAELFAKHMNAQNLPGVYFIPFHFRPFYGSFKTKNCHGVLIRITNPRIYKPFSVQCSLIGILKSLYPSKVEPALKNLEGRKRRGFCLAVGNDEILAVLQKEKYVVWKLIGFQQIEKERFIQHRKKYLLY